MYPVVEDNVRKSIFAIEKLKTCNYINNKVQSNNKRFNNELPVVINPDFGQIQQLQDCNVVYTNLETLEPLLIHLFKTEQTIYQCSSYNRNIMQIQYKKNVNIQINADYQSSLYNCQQLQIPFKNQNNVQLANEAFEIYRQSTRISSSFNKQVKQVFLSHIKSPFCHTFYIPDKQASLQAIDIQKCHTACSSIYNK
jgi:hypothetical protein